MQLSIVNDSRRSLQALSTQTATSSLILIIGAHQSSPQLTSFLPILLSCSFSQLCLPFSSSTCSSPQQAVEWLTVTIYDLAFLRRYL